MFLTLIMDLISLVRQEFHIQRQIIEYPVYNNVHVNHFYDY